MKRLMALMAFLLPMTALAGVCRFPVPKYKIHAETGTGISQADFNNVLDEIEVRYQPIFTAMHGQSLKFNRLWSDGTINSDASWHGSICVVDAYGGLARFPTMTKEAYMLVELHEIGHCLGGAPTFKNDPLMSVEGQADYYAASIGARNMGMDPSAPSMTTSTVLAQLSGDQMPWRPGPVLQAVMVLFEDHPAAQCRLDTYDDAHVGRERPNCWYPNGSPTGGALPVPQPVPVPQPIPNPVPVPTPSPAPSPTPQPAPGPCACKCCCGKSGGHLMGDDFTIRVLKPVKVERVSE